MKLRRDMDGVKPVKEICSRFGIPAIFAIADFTIDPIVLKGRKTQQLYCALLGVSFYEETGVRLLGLNPGF